MNTLALLGGNAAALAVLFVASNKTARDFVRGRASSPWLKGIGMLALRGAGLTLCGAIGGLTAGQFSAWDGLPKGSPPTPQTAVPLPLVKSLAFAKRILNRATFAGTPSTAPSAASLVSVHENSRSKR